MKAVHFEYTHTFERRRTGCGAAIASGRTTDDLDKVTCQACRKTYAFVVRKNMRDREERTATTHARTDKRSTDR